MTHSHKHLEAGSSMVLWISRRPTWRPHSSQIMMMLIIGGTDSALQSDNTCSNCRGTQTLGQQALVVQSQKEIS